MGKQLIKKGIAFPYTVLENGKVISHRNNKEMKIFIRGSRGGAYPSVRVTVNKKSYNLYLHRLLAELFIPIPDRLKHISMKNLIVDHKNGNKMDYSLSNLRWVTKSENQLFRYANQNLK